MGNAKFFWLPGFFLVARAVVEEAERRGLTVPEGAELVALPGRGARARVGARDVVLGSLRLFEEESLLDEGGAAAMREAEATVATRATRSPWGPASSASDSPQ